jgi:hypothetical protein
MFREKLECPRHGIRAVKAQEYPTGTWFKCRRCDFKRWVETQSFMVMASMVLIACYVKSWIVILGSW